MDTNHGGSNLDADHPQQGVNVPRLTTPRGQEPVRSFFRPTAAPALQLLLALLALLAVSVDSVAQAQTVTLQVSPNPIGENGETAMVTATVSPAATTPFTVDVSAQAFTLGVPELEEIARFTMSANTTLAFDANATTSTGTVTITAVNNDGHTDQFRGGVTVEVGGTVSGGTGVTNPSSVTLTITGRRRRGHFLGHGQADTEFRQQDRRKAY